MGRGRLKGHCWSRCPAPPASQPCQGCREGRGQDQPLHGPNYGASETAGGKGPTGTYTWEKRGQSSYHQRESLPQQSFRQGFQDSQTTPPPPKHTPNTTHIQSAPQDLIWLARGVNGNRGSRPAHEATFSQSLSLPVNPMGTLTCSQLERDAKEIMKLDGSLKCRTRSLASPA